MFNLNNYVSVKQYTLNYYEHIADSIVPHYYNIFKPIDRDDIYITIVTCKLKENSGIIIKLTPEAKIILEKYHDMLEFSILNNDINKLETLNYQALCEWLEGIANKQIPLPNEIQNIYPDILYNTELQKNLCLPRVYTAVFNTKEMHKVYILTYTDTYPCIYHQVTCFSNDIFFAWRPIQIMPEIYDNLLNIDKDEDINEIAYNSALTCLAKQIAIFCMSENLLAQIIEQHVVFIHEHKLQRLSILNKKLVG